jgi:tetratricopeptide (TPR) repeat protein
MTAYFTIERTFEGDRWEERLKFKMDDVPAPEAATPVPPRLMEDRLGREDSNTATSIHNLAMLYRSQGRNEEAELLLQRALEIRERVLGPEHPDTADSLNNLAELYRAQGRFEEAERLTR